jgi:hypothetical protein
LTWLQHWQLVLQKSPIQLFMNGTTPPPIPPTGPMPQPKTLPLAVWSLVLGILSLFCLSIFGAIPAVICGHNALRKIEKSSGHWEEMAWPLAAWSRVTWEL